MFGGAVSLLAVPVALLGGSIGIQPSSVTTMPGQTITLAVQVTNITDLYAWQFDLSFDPTILTAIGITEGGFLDGGDSTTTFFIPGTIDNNAGTLTANADALLSAVSAHGGWDPSRDERGVVVTLRAAFTGTALAADAERQLRELGRVAASHARFPVQVVLHDATPPGPAEQAADTERGKATLAALGAQSFVTSVETMGASLPTTDPADPQNRARNARLEVVFVSRTD